MSKDKPGSQYKDTINLPKTAFPMKAGLPNREPQIIKKWQSLNVYHTLQQQRAEAEPFILHDGPPYANGNIHTGHAMQKILKDIIITLAEEFTTGIATIKSAEVDNLEKLKRVVSLHVEIAGNNTDHMACSVSYTHLTLPTIYSV